MSDGKRVTFRLGDWLAWGAARLGWPGLLGLALLGASLALCQVGVHPLEAEAIRLETQAAVRARQPAPAQGAPLPDWRTLLPADDQAYVRLAGLFKAAHAAGLALDEGNYRTQAETRSGLVRRVVTLPVSGSYPALREFLAEALNQDEALALEGLRLSRDSLENPELQAELRFAFYLGDRP